MYVSTVELPQKTDYKDVVNISEGDYKLMTFVCGDCERFFLISKCISILPGNSYTRTRYTHKENVVSQTESDRVELMILQPKCAEEIYSSCSQIDRHNQSRQANLKIDKRYGTNHWEKRVNLTVFGAICVDAWYLKDTVLGNDNDELRNQFYERIEEK